MTGALVLVDVEESVRQLLRQQLASVLSIAELTADDDFFATLAQKPWQTDAMVLGAGVTQAVGFAQRINALDRDLAIVILSEPHDYLRLKNELMLAPFFGNTVKPWSLAELAALAIELRETVPRARQRRAYRNTLHAAQIRLGALGRPRAKVTRYLDRLLEHLPIGIVNLDSQGKVLSLNRSASDLLSVALSEAVGLDCLRLFPQPAHAELQSLIEQPMAVAGEPRRSIIKLKPTEGRFIELRVIPLADYDGQPMSIVMLQDVTESRLLIQQMAHQASHDALTGLINRREFEQRLARALESARTRSAEHALCYLDLDRFKSVNDSGGHIAGDEFLQQLSDLLQRHIRQRDSLARFGGDEFALLLEHCPLQQAERVADTLRKCVEAFRFTWQEDQYSVGVSIGIVAITAASGHRDTVLSAADKACYQAKAAGRNRICVLSE